MKQGFCISLALGAWILSGCTENEKSAELDASIQVQSSIGWAYLVPASFTHGKPTCLADSGGNSLGKMVEDNEEIRLVILDSIPSLDSLRVGTWTAISTTLPSDGNFSPTDVNITLATASRVTGTYQPKDESGDPMGPKRSFNAKKCPDF
jgi:hypothetical protein